MGEWCTKCFYLFLFIIVASSGFSQDSIPDAQTKIQEKYYVLSDRKWLVELPIWIPGFRGRFTFGEFNLESSDESSDREPKRISNELGLEFFFVGRTAVNFNRFWAHFDAFSASISTQLLYDRIINQNQEEILNLYIKMTVSKINMGYSVWRKSNDKDFKVEVFPYVGARFFNVKLEANLFDSLYNGNVTTNWIDPIVGIYIPVMYKRFLFNVQADIGGTSSKLSWMFVGQAQYRISKLIDVKMGWNYLDMKYETAVLEKAMELNIVLSGPTVGVGFRF